MSFQPGQQIGPYRLLRLLGSGGMGEVYEAVHDRIARQVAIKILYPDLARSSEIAGRFLNEARAVNIVRHPGLVQISDFGQLPDGTTYIVMEHLAGETLAEHLKRQGGRLLESQAVYLGEQIALALAAAHEKQIVHRDLKPANVMLVHDPSFPGGLRVKLLDFGIAKVGRENQAPGDMVKTNAGVFLGSPLYMSPEQCNEADKVQPPADVYSLGVMLYHMLSGELPFSAENAVDIIGMHLFKPPPALRSKVPQVSLPLAALVDSMLRKAPQERPTMAAVAQKLGSCLRTQQPLPEPASWVSWRRRLAIGVAASLVGLAAVAVVLGTSGISWHQPGGFSRCNAAGFCREPLAAEISRLRAVVVLSAHDVWACGDPGMLVHFDGQQWKIVDRERGHRLHQLFGFGPGDIWAVGDNGTLLHYDGALWHDVPSGSRAYLTSIWGARPDDVWVVGKASEGQAALLHYDGTAWHLGPSGTPQNLLSVWGVRRDLIWAVGHQGTVLQYDGTVWRQLSGIPTTEKLISVWGTSERDVWVVGREGVALHFDGQTWSLLPTQVRQNLNAGWSRGPHDVWVVGNQGVILHHDGSRFVPLDSGVRSDLDWVAGATDAAGRHLWIAGDPATLLHRRD